MDEIDKKILNILKEEGRAPYVDIAGRVDLTEGAVRRRISNLIKDGTIKKFTIDTSAAVESVVLIKTDPTMTRKTAESLKEHSYRVFELSGEYDIMSLVQAYDIKDLNEKVDSIRETQGVTDTITLVKLNEYF